MQAKTCLNSSSWSWQLFLDGLCVVMFVSWVLFVVFVFCFGVWLQYALFSFSVCLIYIPLFQGKKYSTPTQDYFSMSKPQRIWVLQQKCVFDGLLHSRTRNYYTTRLCKYSKTNFMVPVFKVLLNGGKTTIRRISVLSLFLVLVVLLCLAFNKKSSAPKRAESMF